MAARSSVSRRTPVVNNTKIAKRKTAKRSSRSSPRRKKGKGISGATAFWLLFIVIILFLFIVNMDNIFRGVEVIQREFSAQPDEAEEAPAPSALPTPNPATSPAPSAAAPAPSASSAPTATTSPAASPAPTAAPAPAAAPPPAATAPAPAEELHDRYIYLVQVDNIGNIHRIRTNRRLPQSASPLNDSLNALLAGPTASEMERGMMTMIPVNSRLQSAVLRGDVAHVSFNEEFQYNVFGAEGLREQIRQVVFTVTEFPSINSVQILIDGARVEFIGEGVRIGNPLSRDDY